MPDQEVSEPEDGAGHSLKETSSNNIHLPRLERGYTQAQLPPALDSNSRAIHLCMTTTVNQEYKLRLLTQAQQWGQGLTVLILGTRDNNPRRELHRIPGSEWVRSECFSDQHNLLGSHNRGCTRISQNKHRLFPPISGLHEVSCRQACTPHTQALQGRMEEE